MPASLRSTKFLQEKYSKPINEISITSKNFSESHIWLEVDNGVVNNPYKILRSNFEGSNEEQLETTLSEIKDIDNGGAALAAYGKLQYTDLQQDEIDELSSALLKYYELDSLAMVMIFKHFKEIVAKH